MRVEIVPEWSAFFRKFKYGKFWDELCVAPGKVNKGIAVAGKTYSAGEARF